MTGPTGPSEPTGPTGPAGPAKPVESAEPAEPAESTAADADADADAAVPRVRRFRRVRRLFAPLAPVGRVLNKVPHPSLKSKRGIFVLFLLVAGVGAVAAVGGTMAVHYSETAGFCGRCHTMDPELKAYAMSPHKEVTCAECHVEPGVAGFVKAKANGTKQLLGIITGEYPTPIPPPDHAHLPSVEDSCLECHSLEKITRDGGPVKLVLRPRYRLDAANTRETVAVMIRPAGLGQAVGAGVDGAAGVRGVHWHVEQKVTYTSGDIRAQKIDLVEISAEDGSTKQYIAGTEVAVSTNVQPDIDRLKKTQTTQGMDCISCHNRVGHAVPSPERAVDEAMTAGRISAALPFIKRDGVALLNGDYQDLEAADKAFTGLRVTYAAKYPLVVRERSTEITEAIEELKQVYRLIATPAMKVQAKTYPDNLGHQTSPGCFRCHDGAHFLVEKGKITSEKIPSACATCHTFPQIGPSVTTPVDPEIKPVSYPITAVDVPIGAKPADHKDRLYVFNHKSATSSLKPAGTSCGTCHTPTYCANCHNSGAVKVKHDEMLYKHTKAITVAGGAQACGYCHQPVYCAKCHKEPVLQPKTPPLAIKGRRVP